MKTINERFIVLGDIYSTNNTYYQILSKKKYSVLFVCKVNTPVNT